jgi:hypothetical protein
MSRKLTGGSAKASAGITVRVYRVFYLNEKGEEIQHPKRTYGISKEDAMQRARRICG